MTNSQRGVLRSRIRDNSESLPDLIGILTNSATETRLVDRNMLCAGMAWKRFVSLAAVCCFALSLVPISFGAEAENAGQIRPDFLMDSDPRLVLPNPVLVFDDRCRALWLEALARPEADLQRLSASTIAQAHQRGMSGLHEAEPLLVKIVSAEGTHRATRFAAARALIVLEARTAAPALFDASQRFSGELRQIVEPVLAEWDFQPVRQVWRERLEAQSTRQRDLLLAIRGLGAVGDESALAALVSIVHDSRQLPATRIAAARSAGRISETGLEQAALRLLKSPSPAIPDRLSAAGLLDRHRSPDAVALFLKLAEDSEPSVAAAALGCLNQINPDLALALAEPAMKNADPQVRKQGVETYVARPSPQRAVILVRLLDDPHPAVRMHIREQLLRLTQVPECDTPIREAVLTMLTSASWRGQEQAALLLGALDHKAAAGEMVTLLESQRGEVMVAAAWCLRKLAVADTLPAILDKALRQTDEGLGVRSRPEFDQQVAHLLEALGDQKYAPAEPLWRRFVPKNLAMGEYSRGAAIWSLGRFYAGKGDDALSRLLVQRVTDPAPPPMTEPEEYMIVRVTSAVALGRMGAVAHVERMRRYMEPKETQRLSSLAIRWAIKELTGEILPEPEPAKVPQIGWFLEPLVDYGPKVR
jgi:HEAT repeat protein